ncbi:MAG: shikimate kinase [Janthinobacterium lividum]
MNLIFLIGFMGCGKTTHGRKLATFLGFHFVDLDDVFEAQTGTTITNYFTVFGEEKFRKTESGILKNTAYPENTIISTGGGLPVFFDNLDWMKRHGNVIYLQVPPGIIASRLAHAKADRPLLRHKTGEELLQYVTQKLAEREPFYLQAQIIADGVGLTPRKLAGLLALSSM